MSNNTIIWANTVFGYEPSKVLPIVMLAQFGAAGLVHAVQISLYKAYYLIPIVIGAFFECVAFSMRLQAIANPYSSTFFAAQHGLLVLSPVFFAAADYMILGRVIRTVGSEFSPIDPKWISRIFVGLDIFSFFIQGGGSGILLSSTDPNQINAGLYALTGGLIVQAVSFGAYIWLAIYVHKRASKIGGRWHTLMIALYISAICILVRSIYRVIEFSQGFSSDIAHNEHLMYSLDSGFMFAAILVFNMIHPGLHLTTEGKCQVTPITEDGAARNMVQVSPRVLNAPLSTK